MLTLCYWRYHHFSSCSDFLDLFFKLHNLKYDPHVNKCSCMLYPWKFKFAMFAAPRKIFAVIKYLWRAHWRFPINTDAQITAQLCRCKVRVFSEVQQPISGLSPRGPAAWWTQGCPWSMVVTLQWWQRASQGRLWGLLRFPLGITEEWQLHPYVLGYPAVLREGTEPARQSSSSSELPLVPHSSLFGDFWVAWMLARNESAVACSRAGRACLTLAWCGDLLQADCWTTRLCLPFGRETMSTYMWKLFMTLHSCSACLHIPAFHPVLQHQLF